MEAVDLSEIIVDVKKRPIRGPIDSWQTTTGPSLKKSKRSRYRA
jgi:hypothetical protein